MISFDDKQKVLRVSVGYKGSKIDEDIVVATNASKAEVDKGVDEKRHLLMIKGKIQKAKADLETSLTKARRSQE